MATLTEALEGVNLHALMCPRCRGTRAISGFGITPSESDMRRNVQVRRILGILRELIIARGRGVTLPDLAEYFEVSERTVRRDLAAIEDLGYELEVEKLHDGYGNFTNHYFLAPVSRQQLVCA
jgi:hypothetical protein